MAKKSNIRSIRFSDDLAELIDQQIGRSFTEKFENLITRCVWELPAKKAELERVQKMITLKKEQLHKLSAQAADLTAAVNDIAYRIAGIQRAIDQAVQKLDM